MRIVAIISEHCAPHQNLLPDAQILWPQARECRRFSTGGSLSCYLCQILLDFLCTRTVPVLRAYGMLIRTVYNKFFAELFFYPPQM